MFTPRAKRGIITVYIIIILLSGGFTGSLIIKGPETVGSVQAAFIYVDSLGGGQYTSIQEAIDNATVGDTIVVANGTYYESVLINKSKINLVGNSSSECKIIYQYDGEDDLNDYAAAINVTASMVNISGFNITVSGNYIYGIRLNSTSSSNANITNNNISIINLSSGDAHGIYLYLFYECFVL